MPVYGLEQGGPAWRCRVEGRRVWAAQHQAAGRGGGGGSGVASSGGSRSAASRARLPQAGGRGCSKQRRWGADVWALLQYLRGLNQFKDFKRIRINFEFVQTCFGSKRIFPTSKILK
jgi:hypothetical protein